MCTTVATQQSGVVVDDAIVVFERFLASSMNVSRATRDYYSRHAKAFLEAVADSTNVVGFERLSGARVRSYVTALGDRYAPQSLKLMTTSIRCFLRFAWLSGWTEDNLAAAVGFVVTHRSGKLPKALLTEDLQQLLAAPDRHTLVGIRDYAVLLVLSR